MRQLLNQKTDDMPFQIIKRLSVEFTFADRRRRDLSNAFESVADLLVDVGILADDSWAVVPAIDIRFAGVDKHRAGCTITIERVPLPTKA